MSISQKKTCSLLSGCCVSSIFNLNQVIELDLGFATTLVNSKSPLASTDWETPEISLCFRGLLLAFQIVGDLCLLYIQLLALLVTGEFFLLSSFALGFLYLGSTLSAQLSCTNLWTTSVLHWVKVQSVLEEFFFFFWFFDLFMYLLQSVTSLDKASECVPEGFPSALLCNLHWLTLVEGPTHSKGKCLSECLPCPSFWHIRSLC